MRRALVGTIVLLLAAAGVGLAAVGSDEPAVRAAMRRPAATTTTTEAPTTTVTTPAVAPAPPPTTAPPGPPVPGGSADEVAAQLLAAEAAIRNPALAPADLAHHGHQQQVAYRTLGAHPEWVPAVLAKLPAELHDAVGTNVHAELELRALAPKRLTKLPTGWVIVPPAPAEELLAHYREAEATFGVPWQYLAAIHLVETRMGRIRGTSSAGAQGPMQFMPATWARFGQGDVHSNRDSILAAARYLRHNGAPATMRTALWNYNRSYHYVDAVNAYALQMSANERAFFGYFHWQVYYRTVNGDHLLPVGWSG